MAAAMRWPFFIGLTSLDHWLAPCDRQEDSGRSRSCRSLIAIRQKSGFYWWYGWKMRTRIDLLSDTCEQSERCAPRRRILRRLAFDPNDGIVVRSYPNLAVD